MTVDAPVYGRNNLSITSSGQLLGTANSSFGGGSVSISGGRMFFGEPSLGVILNGWETASNYLNIMSMGDLIIANDIKTQPEQVPPGPFGFGFAAVNSMSSINLMTNGGNITTANLDASGLAAPCCTAPTGMPGFGGGMTSGGNGGSINIMGRSVQTGYIHTFGGGGSGGLDFSSMPGRGGDGGSLVISSSNVVVNGDINSSGGGGGAGGGSSMAGSGGNAGSLNIFVMPPMFPDPQTGNLTIRGPVLAAGGGGGQSSQYVTSSAGGGSFGGGGGGGNAGAGGGGFFGGGGSQTGFFSQGGGANGGGLAASLNNGAIISNGSYGQGGNGQNLSNGVTTIGGLFGQSGISEEGHQTTVTQVPMNGFFPQPNFGDGQIGQAGQIQFNAKAVSINGTVSTEFSGLSQAAVNPFSNSPFANYSLYGGSVTITTNSFSAPGVVYAQSNLTVQESQSFGNSFLIVSDAKFNSNMLNFSGTTLNFNGNIQFNHQGSFFGAFTGLNASSGNFNINGSLQSTGGDLAFNTGYPNSLNVQFAPASSISVDTGHSIRFNSFSSITVDGASNGTLFGDVIFSAQGGQVDARLNQITGNVTFGFAGPVANVDLETVQGNLTVAAIDATAQNDFSSGGSVRLVADGGSLYAGNILSQPTSGGALFGQPGGSIYLSARGPSIIAGATGSTVSISVQSNDQTGGTLSLDGAVRGDIVQIYSNGDMTVDAPVYGRNNLSITSSGQLLGTANSSFGGGNVTISGGRAFFGEPSKGIILNGWETASINLNISSMGDLIIANDIKTQPEQITPGPFGFGFAPSPLNAANINLMTMGGNVVTANLDASGLAAPCCTAPTGMPGPGGMPSGGNGGSVNIMGRSIQTGYIHTYGAGGSGGLDFSSMPGRGGDGGTVFISSSNVVVNGDINSSGGGGGAAGGGSMAGSGGNAGSINIIVMAPMFPDPQSGNITIRGPVLAAGGGGGQSSQYVTSSAGGGSFGGGGGGGNAGAGGGGFFGGGGSQTGFFSQGGGANGGGLAASLNNGAIISNGSYGQGGNGQNLSNGVTTIGGLFGQSGISEEGHQTTVTPVPMNGFLPPPNFGDGQIGQSGQIQLSGKTVSINGTVNSEFSGLSQAAVNPFSNSPFANYSLYGGNVTIIANSFSAPGVVYAQNNLLVQESQYFGNSFLNISNANFNASMLNFSGTNLNISNSIFNSSMLNFSAQTSI